MRPRWLLPLIVYRWPFRSGPLSVVIWTTTPGPCQPTVPSLCTPNWIICAGSGGGDNRSVLILAEALVKDVMDRAGINQYHNLGYHCKGATLELLRFTHPFYSFDVPVILGDHVTTLESGTGAVHTAPGPRSGRLRGRPEIWSGSGLTRSVATASCLPDTELFAGQHVFKANASVVEVLKGAVLCCTIQAIQHSYPHCWRHKTPIIFRATPQWFIRMEQAGLRRRRSLRSSR